MRATAFLAAAALVAAAVPAGAEDPPGERPAVSRHLDQAAIEAGTVTTAELLRQGRRLFEARFNRLDGQGRPATTGHGVPRPATQPAFTRLSGPDANSCAACHHQPRTGGTADFAANVFVLAQERDPVVETLDPGASNERGSMALMGAGAVELLAREMSRELQAVRERARAAARAGGAPVRRTLVAKGVSFGAVTVLPDGRVDPREIDGVDWDLVVRPFHQKGAVASLREFTVTALNHHHGVQAVERFGAGLDPDADGVADELTVGDVTALTLFQAALGTPGRALPRDPVRAEAVRRGEHVFGETGCAVCHVPALTLESAVFSEPGPFNPPGNLRPQDTTRAASLDLTREGPGPHLEALPGGGAVVRLFSDLKRHDLNDADYRHFANEQVFQGTLLARARAALFTATPPARPRAAFLTHRLWDAGSTDPYGHQGDLTTLTEAIHFHGGDARAARDAFFALPPADRAAVVAFLKTLQILPEGADRESVVDDEDR